MTLLITYAIIAILASFLCSILEAVLLSISPSYVKKQEGTSIGKSLEKFKKDIDEPLSAILTLNTIAHTVGAILVGVQAAAVFQGEDYFGVNGELIVSIVMTIAILLLSEIIPKTIGASNWEALAPFTVRSINILLIILKPIIWVTKLITSRFKGGSHESVLTRADFLVMNDLAHETGEINKSESIVINNMLKLKDLSVKDIMTPNMVMFSAHPNENIEEFYNTHKPLKFSRIPLWNKEKNEVIGIVLKDDLLESLANDKHELEIHQLKKEAIFIKNDESLEYILNHLIAEKVHLAIVVNEFGSIDGLVTLEDILETILGMEITDETDGHTNLQALARKQWESRAKKMGILE